MNFRLEINTNNVGMGDRYDVALALQSLSRKLMDNDNDQGVVHDINGNKVGAWELTEGDRTP